MSFDWSMYRGNLTWLPERTIFLTRYGSHAYGTNIATSDEDFRGVAVPPSYYYHGFLDTFELAESNEPDLSIYEICKWFKLAADCNPNIIEGLFTDPSDHIILHPVFQRVLDNRDAFLSTKAKHTYSGYAISQLRRIQRHYRWLKDPPKAPPTRTELGLPEYAQIPANQLEAANAAIRKTLDKWNWHDLENVDLSIRQQIKDDFFQRLLEITGWTWDQSDDMTWLAATRSLGFDTNFIEVLKKERVYNAAVAEWKHYLDWKKTRNPARAALEEKHGYDTKHAMHLVRLLRMGKEILVDGKVIVRRPDAAELLAIRNGAWTYEQLLQWAQEAETELQAVQTSPLPKAPNRKRLNELAIQVVEEMLRDAKGGAT